MKLIGQIVAVVFGVSLLGATGFGAFLLFQYSGALFANLEPQVATIIAMASVVAFLCASMIAGGFKWIGRKEAEAQARADKASLYERIVLIWGERLNNRTQAIEPATEDELHRLERLLTLRGNAKVIKTYGELQGLEKNVGLHSPDIPSQVAKVLLEMRKDLGRDVLTLNENDLVNVLNVEGLQDRPASIPQQVGRPQVSLSQGA